MSFSGYELDFKDENINYKNYIYELPEYNNPSFLLSLLLDCSFCFVSRGSKQRKSAPLIVDT